MIHAIVAFNNLTFSIEIVAFLCALDIIHGYQKMILHQLRRYLPIIVLINSYWINTLVQWIDFGYAWTIPQSTKKSHNCNTYKIPVVHVEKVRLNSIVAVIISGTDPW